LRLIKVSWTILRPGKIEIRKHQRVSFLLAGARWYIRNQSYATLQLIFEHVWRVSFWFELG